MGLPVVVSDVDYAGEMVFPGETGRLFLAEIRCPR
jgi:hypothetical protein